MNTQQDPNFLPQDEKQRANEVLQKQPQQGNAEMKLVVPKMEDAGNGKSKKKESFWAKRKRLKEEKRQAKLRQKGETGLVKDATNKTQPATTSKLDAKPELFSDVIAQKQQPKPVQERVKPQSLPEKKMAAPKPSQLPKIESKKPKKEESAQQLVEKTIKKEDKKNPASSSAKNEPITVSKKMHQPEQSENFDGPSVNLVPDTMMPQAGGPKWMLGAIILLVTVALWVIIGGIGVSRAKKAEAQVEERTNRLNQLTKVIGDYESGKVAAQSLQDQFEAVEELVDNHLYWTPIIEKLEENTLSDVYYLAINADETTGVISLRAIAKNYAAAARQIRSFQLVPNFISDVTVGEVRVENQPEAELPVPIVTFDLQLTLTEGVLTFVAPETSN